MNVQLLLAMAMQFQEIIALQLQVKISFCSMPCAGNATSEKLAIFPSADFANTLIEGDKLPM